MRRLAVLFTLVCCASAQQPTVLLDFETGEPADGWNVRNLALAEITVPKGKTPSAGRALKLISKGERKGSYRGLVRRTISVTDWRSSRALSFYARVEADGPIEMRIIGIRGNGPAGLLRRFTLKPGDWREVVLPLKDFRENLYDQVCGFEKIDKLLIRWDRGAGAVSFDDVRLLPGTRGVLSCVPTTEDRIAAGFGPTAKKAKAFESKHFVVMTDVAGANKRKIRPLLDRLEAGLKLLHDRYKIDGSFDDRVPLYLFTTLDGYRAAVIRFGKHYGAGIGAPKAQGYSFFGVGMSVFIPAKGWDRPVFLHEAMHGAVHRLLGVASNGNWIQESLAPAVQVTLFPEALDRKKFASAFHTDKEGWLQPWSTLLSKKGISTRNYPQALSFIEFLRDQHGEKLGAVWAAVRDVRDPIHKQAMPAIAKALGTDPKALETEWLLWGKGYYEK